MGNLMSTFVELQQRVDVLEKDIGDLRDLLKKVKGEVTIQGYMGKRLDLNDNLNVVGVLKRITDAEERLTILETP
jgi:hypothetical protein